MGGGVVVRATRSGLTRGCEGDTERVRTTTASGEVIGQVRRRLGRTGLSWQSGASGSDLWIAKFEMGGVVPSVEVLGAIAEVLEVRAEERAGLVDARGKDWEDRSMPSNVERAPCRRGRWLPSLLFAFDVGELTRQQRSYVDGLVAELRAGNRALLRFGNVAGS